MVVPLINYCVLQKEDNEKIEVEIDKDILELRDDSSKIVSPDPTVKFVAKGETLASTPENEVEDKELAEIDAALSVEES